MAPQQLSWVPIYDDPAVGILGLAGFAHDAGGQEPVAIEVPLFDGRDLNFDGKVTVGERVGSSSSSLHLDDLFQIKAIARFFSMTGSLVRAANAEDGENIAVYLARYVSDLVKEFGNSIRVGENSDQVSGIDHIAFNDGILNTENMTIEPYTIELNQPPIVGDDTVDTAFETAIVIDVLVNDTDPDDRLDPATVDSFTYTVADTAGLDSAPATVTIRVGEELDLIIGADGSNGLSGTTGDDLILGLAGNDVIDGQAGDDILFGGSGNDVLRGGADDDILVGGPGNDTIDGGPGLDIAIFAGERADFTVTNLGRVVQLQGTGDGRDTLTSVEILQFDDGFLDLRDNSFTDGFANERVETLMTRPGFSTDPAPTFATSVSTAQVENLIVAAEIGT